MSTRGSIVERTFGSNGHRRAVGAPSMARRDPDRAGTRGAAPVPGRIMEPAMPLTGDLPGDAPAARRTDGRDPDLGRRRSDPGRAAQRGVAGRNAARVRCRPAAPPAHRAPAPATATAAAPGRADRRHHGGRRARADHAEAIARRRRSDVPSSDAAATDRCAEERRLAEERCELATRARPRPEAAADALRAAQRATTSTRPPRSTAAWRADPRAVHDAKDAAQGGFRAAVAAASSPDAARGRRARLADRDQPDQHRSPRGDDDAPTREHAAAGEIGATLERLGLEADAARIGAENADAACLAARERRRRLRRAAGRGSGDASSSPPVAVPASACPASTRTRRSARRSTPAASPADLPAAARRPRRR